MWSLEWLRCIVAAGLQATLRGLNGRKNGRGCATLSLGSVETVGLLSLKRY